MVTVGGNSTANTFPSAFLFIPVFCTDRFVCYWRIGIYEERLVRRRRKVHNLKCTTDLRKMCFPSCACVSVSSDASVLFFFSSWWEQSLTIFSVSFVFWQTHRTPSRRCQWQCGSTLQFSSLLCSLLCNFITIIIPLVKNVMCTRCLAVLSYISSPEG